MIYFVRDEGFIKIGHVRASFKDRGWPRTVLARYRNLLCGNPRNIELLGVIAGEPSREQWLHRIFVRDHHQREWFTTSDRLLKFIERTCTTVPLRSKQIGTQRIYEPSLRARVLLELSVKASCDPRTILGVFNGSIKVRSVSSRRAYAALVEAGLLQDEQPIAATG